MEWFKRLKKADPYLLLSKVLFVNFLLCLLFGFSIIGLDFFTPVDKKEKFQAVFSLVFGLFMAVLYLATSAIRRQREADARFRGLAAYVEKLRAYTVPRIDSIEDFLQGNTQEEAAPPPAVVPTEPTIEKPLLTRERDTLLTIIAALAKASKIDIKAPGKSAQYIEGLTDELGAHVSKRAIEDHLKRIPDALETRMK